MSILCHHNAIPQGSVYCPECGAPQLRVASPDEREAQRQAELLAGNSEEASRHTGAIAWPAAIRAALICAVQAGFLVALRENPGLLDMVWIVIAAVWTLRLYGRAARRVPVLTPQLGGRIGLLLGLFAAVIAVLTQAARLLVERYGLHAGGAIDARLQGYAQTEIDLINASNPDALRQFGWLAQFWLSPEGKSVLLLLTVMSGTLSILFFAWLSGRFAVRYAGALRRKR